MLRYADYRPSPALAAVVDRYWILEGQSGATPEPVLPDGRMEVIFHYGVPFARHCPDGRIEHQHASLLAGQLTAPAWLAPRGSVGVAAVRLRPAAAAAVLGAGAEQFLDQIVPLTDVLPAKSVCDRLSSAHTDRDRIAVLESWLLSTTLGAPRADVAAAVDTTMALGGRVSVASLAAAAGMTRRTLERGFREQVGLPPKTFARVIRLRRAVRLARAGGSLADVALACGYYDHAHMALDFRELAAGSPSAWLRLRGELATLFAD